MGNLYNWIEYDYFERYSTLHEWEIRQKLHLPPATYRDPYEPTGRQVFREFMHAYGETLERSVHEFSRRIGHTCSYADRFLMNCSIDSVPVISWPYTPFAGPGVVAPTGFRIDRYWPYFTPDGQSVFGHIVKITDGMESAKLPVTMWLTKRGGRYQHDFLAWPNKFPLFRLDRLQLADIVYICQSEEQVEKAEAKYGAECGQPVMFSTWPGGFDFTLEKSDWGLLRGKRVAIVFEETRESVQLAYEITKYINRIECEFAGYKLFLPGDADSTHGVGLVISGLFNVAEPMRKGSSCFSPSTFDQYAYEEFEIGQPCAEERDESLESFLAEPDEPDDWVIPQLISQGERVMVYAKAKEGKTTFLLQAAILIALHGKRVAYFDAEMPAKTSKRHLRKALRGRAVPDNFQFISAAKKNKSLNFEVLENQKRWQHEYSDADVIILDNLNKMFPNSLGTDPSSSRPLDAFVDELWQEGKTIILVHHANQGGKQYGTSKKTYALDLTLKVEKAGGNTKITPEEVRSLPEEFGKPFMIPYNDDTGLAEDWFDPEKRYLNAKEGTRTTNRKSTKIPCSDEVEIIKEKQISEGQIDSTDAKNIVPGTSLENAVGNKDEQPEPVSKAIRKPSKASQQRAEDKERARSELQKKPDIKVRELASLLGCSSGKAGDILKEIKAENQNS